MKIHKKWPVLEWSEPASTVSFWKGVRCQAALFFIGGGLYNLIEILWRGYTHWSMFLLGGLCFLLIGGIHTRLQKCSLFWRCTLCALTITAMEFLCGCLVNRVLHLGVWDYSAFPLNLLGQVCLLYTVLWGLLSVIAGPIYRFFRALVEGRLHFKKPVQD